MSKQTEIERKRRRRYIAVGAVITSLLVASNAWAAVAAVHQIAINTDSYKSEKGHWDTVNLPNDMKINAIHAALLSTGKILIVAGSGNDTDMFKAGTFKSVLYNPDTGSSKLVETPSDMFCGGQTMLPDGSMLIAGGTQRYEDLTPTHAGGVMVVKNENPDRSLKLAKGTEFTAPNGQVYKSDADVNVSAAAKAAHGEHVVVTASATTVWVDAVTEGDKALQKDPAQYKIGGLNGSDVNNVYGMGAKMTLNKHDFEGSNKAYVFNPTTEKYETVGDMNEKRWYPTLTGLPDGEVIATSGLDGNGLILQGQTEVYDPISRKWTNREDLARYFPTYPAVFQTQKAGTLFYSGSNAGYGPADKGREPGLWNLGNNSFNPVPGLRSPDLLETSGSSWAGPVQNQTVMVVGGGGVGESNQSTGRIDLIHLNDPQPHFEPGPSLPQGTRYPSIVTLPDDTALITGGSSDYRGKNDSDNHTARIFHPDTVSLSEAADPVVGRNYHSEALLLPDGRVMTLGSNPLFADKNNTEPATFEQRIEVYTPAYLYHGSRPEITAAPLTAQLGDVMTVTSPQAENIVSARLIRPSAVTHVTDVDQRSVALDISRDSSSLKLKLPSQATLVPPGYYMLFLVDKDGTPSVAKWVQVGSNGSVISGMPGM
ncbi:MAG: kelch motif-containing protein [Candidatus Saccharimonadales bacterium]